MYVDNNAHGQFGVDVWRLFAFVHKNQTLALRGRKEDIAVMQGWSCCVFNREVENN